MTVSMSFQCVVRGRGCREYIQDLRCVPVYIRVLALLGPAFHFFLDFFTPPLRPCGDGFWPGPAGGIRWVLLSLVSISRGS